MNDNQQHTSMDNLLIELISAIKKVGIAYNELHKFIIINTVFENDSDKVFLKHELEALYNSGFHKHHLFIEACEDYISRKIGDSELCSNFNAFYNYFGDSPHGSFSCSLSKINEGLAWFYAALGEVEHEVIEEEYPKYSLSIRNAAAAVIQSMNDVDAYVKNNFH